MPVIAGVMFQKLLRANMPYIRITRHPYEEPHHVCLVLEASNDSCQTKFEYYCNATDLSDMAESLEIFPRHNSDVFLYEYGSERKEDRWSYYFRFRAFQVNSTGHCAIQIRTNNNRELPDLEISEFCILAEASQINRLGALFRKFSKLNHKELVWTVDEGTLHENET